MPLSMENGWDEWSTSLCQFLLPTLTSCSWFPSMATRIGPIEGREQSGHIQFFIIFLGYKSWLADVCSKISPKNSPCFFLCKPREAQQFSMARHGKFQRNLRQSGAGRYFHATTKAKLHLQLGNSAPRVWIEICFVDGCNMLHVFQLWNLGWSLGAELRFLTLSSMVRISAGGRSSNHQRWNNQKWSQCFKQPKQFLIISYHHHRLMMVQNFLGRMPI